MMQPEQQGEVEIPFEHPKFLVATGGFDTKVRLFNAETGELLTTYLIESHVVAMAFSGKPRTPSSIRSKLYLAVASAAQIHVFVVSPKPANGIVPILSLPLHEKAITAVGFGRDDLFVYSADESGLIVTWNPDENDARRFATQGTRGGRQPQITVFWRGKNDAGINAMVYNDERDMFVTADKAGALKVWDIPRQECIVKTRPCEDRSKKKTIPRDKNVPVRYLQTCEISVDNRIVIVGSPDGWLFVYSFENLLKGSCTKDPPPPIRLENGVEYILRTSISVDQKFFAVATSTKKIVVYHLKEILNLKPDETKLKPHRTLKGHKDWVWDIAFIGGVEDDQHYLISCSTDSTLRLWKVEEATCVLDTFPKAQKGLTCLAMKEVY
eukprot:Plantae.Rhodophyta-Hildenbrandia_rubra.ctg9314.p1 GENE.Plantae.Rhodophyta-Hildenbrandia_rubra.ctg9314~~Plantae.Rhodophyta-Hildenbrandia_rubra.ctg9314.p1  ORF type:complete len:382 (+),score=58.47 Plantae.Rhodophyta-Hildenbrandia_rubra.ctg9314:177-1322(+)